MSDHPRSAPPLPARTGVPASQRAMAIMARYPRPGHTKTRLAARLGADCAAQIYRAFLTDLSARFTRAARRDGYTLVWAHTPDPGDLRTVVGSTGRLLVQRGADLGERLYNVCADLGDAGYRQVIVTSSDAPQLPAEFVRAAFAALDRLPAVLGPAEDGGYSLVGVRTAPRPPDLFRGIRMSTPLVLAQTLARARELDLAVELLPVSLDVDELPDLLRLSAALRSPAGIVAPAPRTRAILRRLGIG